MEYQNNNKNFHKIKRKVGLFTSTLHMLLDSKGESSIGKLPTIISGYLIQGQTSLLIIMRRINYYTDIQNRSKTQDNYSKLHRFQNQNTVSRAQQFSVFPIPVTLMPSDMGTEFYQTNKECYIIQKANN